MFTDDIQAISDPSALIYGAEPFHAHSVPAIDAGLWPLVPVLLWGFVILRYLLRNYSLRVHLHALAGLFGGMPPFARIGAILFCAICISFGLPKQNPLGGLLDGLVGLPEPVGETVMGASGGMSSSAASASPLTEITTSRVKACSLLVSAETNITFTSEPSSNAIIHQPWLIRGAHEDAFNCAPEGWSFLSGTNTYTNVYVSSSGTLAFRRFQGSPGPAALGDTSAFYLAPLQAAFGIVPAANWDLLSASNSFFWHDVTEQGTARFTWRNALAGRSPDAPVSFQAELLPSGDFTFRYDLGSTSWPSNALAGTRWNGGGENALVDGCTATNHLCASLYSLDGSNLVVTPLCARLNGSTRFALHWKAFLPSDLGDPDNDGIDTADELLVYHTGPRDDDSDDDGLPDGEEVSASLDPSRFSTATNGVSDLLTVITMAGLTNTSIRLGSGTLGTLVITSRLDTAVSDDAAILRITLPGRPSAYIPVLPGTDIVTSVSLPLDAAAVFSLVATRESGISGTPVLGIGADRPLILKDPGRLFGSAVRAMARTLPPVPPAPRAGGFRFPVYSIQPDRVCLHDPNLSFLTISSPDNALMMLTPSGARVYDMDVEWDPDWGELRVGANYRTMDVALSCIDPLSRVVGSHKARVHACRKPDPDPPGGSGGNDDADYDGPGYCCDRYPDCEHQIYGVPVPEPPHDPGHPAEEMPPVHVENRVFILGSAAENYYYGVDPQPTSGFCPYCGHAQDSAGATDYATVTYCSGDLAAYPHVLRRSGEITVRGNSPSTNLWSSVLTIFHGEAYDQRRYTVLGGSVYFDTPGYTVTNAPWPCFAAGVSNTLTFKSDVLLPDGDITVSLDGNASLSMHNRLTDQDEVICTPTQRTYTVSVSLWRQRYCAEDRSARAFLTGHAACAGKITLGYAHPSESQAAFTAAQRFEVAGIVLEPVVSTAGSQGLIYNPAGLAFGSQATYKIEVYPTTISDEDITWSVSHGDAWFYGTGNKGRTANLHGGSTEGEFKLEVDIAGVTLTPKPYIYGKVLAPRTVQIHAYVICNSNNVAAVDLATIEARIAEANRVYQQVAITFTLASIQYIYYMDDWFDIVNDDNDEKFHQMCSYTNTSGGLELYCVNTLGGVPGKHSDMRLAYGDARCGMAVSADASLMTLAHEIGHACGLSDLYKYDAGDGLVSEDKTSALNWSGGTGTGYYTPTLAYRDLTYRCIMEMAHPSATRGDIPLDGLTVIIGTNHTPVRVGLNQMTTREPQH